MEHTETVIKPFEDLKLSDNFMFSAVMQDDENCRKFLELVLGVKILKISRPEVEKTMTFTPESKGIRLDVYVENDDSVYDIEMQTTTDELPRRSRYYQGKMDQGLLKKGVPYKKLRKGIIIFICTFDPFKSNLPVYTFENLCREDNSIKLNDGTLKIFLNTKGDISKINTEMQNLYELINDGNANDDFTNKLKSDINNIKKNDIWRELYMDWNVTVSDLCEKAESKGKLEGKVEALLTIGYNTAKISETLNMPIEEVERIARAVQKPVGC